MEITNHYVLFHPNYLATKKEQIKLEKLLKLSNDKLDHAIMKANKFKVWRVENKAIKKYIPQDSKYRLKQIIKNYKLNKEQLSHGYSNKYINLFTDLLYENKTGKYAKRRLSLIDFRKKILKKKLNTSFEEFVKKEPLSEKFNFAKQNLNNIYLTTVIQRFDKDKYKQKYNCISSRNDKYCKNKNKSSNNRVLLKELSLISNLNDNKYKLKLNTEGNNNNYNNNIIKIYNYNDSYKKNNNNNENKNDNNNLYTGLICNTSLSDSNIYFNTERKNDDEKKYFGKLKPKEEYIQKRNKAKYIDYLKNKYHFFSTNNSKELKNYSEIKKRQFLFFNGKDKIEHALEYPYKKEFFKRYYRLHNKSSRNNDILKYEDKKNNEIFNFTHNLFPKRKTSTKL